VSLLNHILKINQKSVRLLSKEEAVKVLYKVTERFASRQDEEYDPKIEMHKRVIANLMGNILWKDSDRV
jgi:hypothetical protein